MKLIAYMFKVKKSNKVKWQIYEYMFDVKAFLYLWTFSFHLAVCMSARASPATKSEVAYISLFR
jgi:hypothetical protein